MNINSEDFIESRIENIIKENNIYHVGKVVRINSFVIEATGLEDAFFFEKVFVGDENNIGYVDKIEENKVFIALVKTNGNIKIGDSIKTTGEALEASFSKNAMGMVIDAFGVDRITGKSFNESKKIPIETNKIPIMDRTAVNRPLETGIASIDLMFPIGRGQRQLIIGDKKTGKTQILLDTIVNQKGKNVICIYVSIGKTKKEVKRLYSKLVEKGANAYTQIVAVFNDDTSPLIKLTPYVGLSIAEEYMREGYDVLVCIDDLKKHADACREIALISEKNTGREAYPADIFYTHSRLLEKGCQYKNGGSITILPVVETKGGDITDYISTNIISITDGQIVLSEKNFKKGQKPALDFGLSVSRLGGAVQKDSIKKVGAAVRRELLTYLETADVYQLVKIDAMSKELQEKVYRGKKLLELLRQPKFSPRNEEKLIQNFSFILDEHSVPSSSEEEKEEDINNDDNNINNTPNNGVEIITNNVSETVNVANEPNVETNNSSQENVSVSNVDVPVEQVVEVPSVVQDEVSYVENTEVVNEQPVDMNYVSEENVSVSNVDVPLEQAVEVPSVVQDEVSYVENTEVVNEQSVENINVSQETNFVSNENVPVEQAVEVPSVVQEESYVENTEVVNEQSVENTNVSQEVTVPVENVEPVIVNQETMQLPQIVVDDNVVQVPDVEPVMVDEHTIELSSVNEDINNTEELQTTEISVDEIKKLQNDVEKLYTTEIPVEEIKKLQGEVEQLYTTEIPVEEIKKLQDEVEQLYTTEIPVEEIKRLQDEVEQLYTTEIPVEKINEQANVEELYTTEVPVLGNNYSTDVSMPIIEESYTTELPIFNNDVEVGKIINNNMENAQSVPNIKFFYPEESDSVNDEVK